MVKQGVVALVVHKASEGIPQLVEALSDELEIEILELALQEGERDPLSLIYRRRERQTREDESFGNYVEELLSQPVVKPEVQEHALQWLKSKIKIERYQKTESEATRVIADYAYRLFLENQSRKDFVLAGPKAQVRVKIFEVEAEVAAA